MAVLLLSCQSSTKTSWRDAMQRRFQRNSRRLKTIRFSAVLPYRLRLRSRMSPALSNSWKRPCKRVSGSWPTKLLPLFSKPVITHPYKPYWKPSRLPTRYGWPNTSLRRWQIWFARCFATHGWSPWMCACRTTMVQPSLVMIRKKWKMSLPHSAAFSPETSLRHARQIRGRLSG